MRFLDPVCPADNASARAAAVVFSRWEPDARTEIRSLDTLEALVRLKDSGFWVAHRRKSIQNFLDWTQSLPIYEMIYADLDEATAFVKKLLPL